jgi:rhodanese-related sulfurtransferase
MKRYQVMLLAAIVALGVPLAAGQATEVSAQKLRIEWTEFKKLYDGKKVVVVDVRDAESFASGHVPGALSVPLGQVEARTAELKQLNQPIVLYCS